MTYIYTHLIRTIEPERELYEYWNIVYIGRVIGSLLGAAVARGIADPKVACSNQAVSFCFEGSHYHYREIFFIGGIE